MQNTTLFALFQNTKSDNCSWTWRLPSRMQQNPLSKLWFVTHIVKFGLSAIGLRVRYCSLGADNSAFPVSLYSELREVFTKTPSHWHRSPSPNYSFFVVVVGFFFCKKHTTPLLEKKGEWKHTSAGKRNQLTNPEKRVMLIEYIFSTTGGLKGEEVLVCWCTVRARGGEEDRRVQAEWESLTDTNDTETPKITLNISFKSATDGKELRKTPD